MRVNMLYFGVLKELFAVTQETIEVPQDATVGDVLSLSRQRASNLRIAGLRTAGQGTAGQDEVWNALAVAVNREYAERATVLRDGDEVALLPPVSGGVDEERRAA